MADGADDFTHDVGSDPQQALLNFDDEVRKLLRWIYQEHCVRSKGMLLGTLRKLLHLMPLLVPELRNTAGPTPVHIYAAGQRIAREEWGSVSFEHHNPVTGSWVTSNGHSRYRTASREERDPVGAEVPLANPYPAAQSYVDWKSTQPLFIEGGDPFDYTSGRTIDGLPVSEAEFQRRTGNGSVGSGVFVGGKFAGFFDLSERSSFSYIIITLDVFNPPLELRKDPEEWWPAYYYRSFDESVELDSSVGSPSHNQHCSDSNPKQDRKLKMPERMTAIN